MNPLGFPILSLLIFLPALGGIIALLVGMWLDRRLGTQPWLMLLFLVLGLVAGFRRVLRAVARAEKTGHG